MTKQAATTFVFTDLASDGGKAPEWVELLPPGPSIKARDGRQWTYSPATILSAFASNRGPLVIDYEHGQDILADKGAKAPAAGWIVELAERGGGIWGRVEWTAMAATEIADRSYRFLSPSMRHTADGVLTRLAGAGLVNRPALEMTALSREETNSEKDDPMDLKAIAKALGLAETADHAVVIAAIASRNDERAALCQALSVEATADTATLKAAVTKLTDEHKTALARIEEGGDVESLRKSVASLQEQLNAGAIDKALDEAQAAGKITPASRDTYRAICAEKGGIERFASLVKTLPVIGEPSQIGRAAPTTDAVEDDPVALASAARKYQDEQSALGNRISTAQAVQHVKATK